VSGLPPGLPYDFTVKLISAGDPDIAEEAAVAADLLPPDTLGTIQRVHERLLRASPFGRAIGPIPSNKVCLVARFVYRGNSINFFLIREESWWLTRMPISAVLAPLNDLSGLPDVPTLFEPSVRGSSSDVRDTALELASAWESGRCPRVKTIRFMGRCLHRRDCQRPEVNDALEVLRGTTPGRRPCRLSVDKVVEALQLIANSGTI